VIGYIKYGEDKIKLSVYGNGKRKIEGHMEIDSPKHTSKSVRMKLASKELDNLATGLGKVIKGVYYGRKI